MLKAQQFPTARPQRVSAETRPRDDSVSGSGPAHCEGGWVRAQRREAEPVVPPRVAAV